MLVVHHAEGPLREVVEHHAPQQLVRVQDRDRQVALLEHRQQLRVVVQQVQPVPHLLLLVLDQELQTLDVVQLRLP